MPRQAEKYHLSLSGEFFVTAQLHRYGVSASVTYGNAKSADVVAFGTTGKAVFVEVKTSDKGRWPVGGRVPAPSSQPWVFVDMPADKDEVPAFYVLSQEQLHNLLRPGEQQYFERYREKHKKEYECGGVATAKRAELVTYKNEWQTILQLL